MSMMGLWVILLIVLVFGGLLVLGVLIALAFGWRPAFLFPGAEKSRLDPSESRALEILDERYARGEISKEEYQEKRNDILGKDLNTPG